jgi:hypothetical protein
MRRTAFLCITGLLSASAIASPDDALHDFADLVGVWSCHGVFPATGKTIDSSLRFEFDLGGKALVKHHDDTSPPAMYHALEAWGYDAKNGRYNATIFDNFGGARLFSSEGWKNDRLVWTSAPEVKPAQRFIYVREAPQGLRIDWEVAKGDSFVVGDTLHCTPHRTSQ